MEDEGAMNTQPVDDVVEDTFSLTVTYQPNRRWWSLAEGVEEILDGIAAEEARRAFVRKIVGDGPETHHNRAQETRRAREPQRASQ
jgi:hypothetical protein